MNPSLDKPCTSRRPRLGLWLGILLPLYLFSTGPVAWATNDAFHPRYLPEAVEYIYLPLTPLLAIEPINQLFLIWTAVVWHGFPAGYTTL